MTPHILVVGDCMLDVDEHLQTVKESPEGVPVVAVERQDYRLGGASAVGAMCAALGATVDLVGVIGTDEESRIWWRLADQAGIRRLVPQLDRPTTSKLRLFVDGEQTLRIDREVCDPLAAVTVLSLLTPAVSTPDVMLVSDYGKGVYSRELLEDLRRRFPGVPVIVDPALARSWEEYRGATAIVPNHREWMATERPMTLAQAVYEFELEAIVLKQGANGIRLAGGQRADIPGLDVDAADVCGCGDQVLAALGIAIAHGWDWLTAARFANAAGAAKVRKQGATPVSWEEIEDVSHGEFTNDQCPRDHRPQSVGT